MQCMFEMVHLKHIPLQLGHLAGLLELFKDKMVRSCVQAVIPLDELVMQITTATNSTSH